MVLCGHVYHLLVGFTVPQKPKLLVPAFVTADGRVRMFVINTSRTEFQKKESIAGHVLPLARDLHRGFLTHDSWLACHEVIGGWTSAEIEAAPECYRGCLDVSVLATVRNVIGESRLFSVRDKDAFLSQWPQPSA